MRRLAVVAVLFAACGGSPASVSEEDQLGVELVNEDTAAADANEALKADAAGLTSAQARKVLEELNNICGDTWCEGDYSWDFRKIVCTFTQKRCTVTVFITDGYGGPGAWWRSFRVTGLTKYSSMIDSSGDLVDAFYEKVDIAVSHIEGNLR